MDAPNKMLQHHFGGVKVGDHAIPQGTHGNNIARCPPQHPLRLFAHSQRRARSLVDRDDGGLLEHNASACHIDKCIGSTQVNTHITGEATKQ